MYCNCAAVKKEWHSVRDAWKGGRQRAALALLAVSKQVAAAGGASGLSATPRC